MILRCQKVWLDFLHTRANVTRSIKYLILILFFFDRTLVSPYLVKRQLQKPVHPHPTWLVTILDKIVSRDMYLPWIFKYTYFTFYMYIFFFSYLEDVLSHGTTFLSRKKTKNVRLAFVVCVCKCIPSQLSVQRSFVHVDIFYPCRDIELRSHT